MRNLILQSLSTLLTLNLVAACSAADTSSQGSSSASPLGEPTTENPPVSSCVYEEIAGVATIVALETPSASEYSCPNNPIRVKFEFTPDDPKAVLKYSEGTSNFWTIHDGANPPQGCLESLGISKGARIVGKRAQILSGTCTPVVWRLSVDASACETQCRTKG